MKEYFTSPCHQYFVNTELYYCVRCHRFFTEIFHIPYFLKVPQHVNVKDNTKIKLQVHGVSQDGKHHFKKEQQLFLEKTENKEAFFIQTEKSIYNPGETGKWCPCKICYKYFDAIS